MEGVVPFETGMAKLHRGSGGISQLLGWEVSARRPKQSIPLGKVVEVRGREPFFPCMIIPNTPAPTPVGRKANATLEVAGRPPPRRGQGSWLWAGPC